MENTKIIQLLSDLVMIPSISSLDENQKDVLDSANYIADLFNEIGLNSKVTSSKNSKPAVLAQTEIDPSKKTVLGSDWDEWRDCSAYPLQRRIFPNSG